MNFPQPDMSAFQGFEQLAASMDVAGMAEEMQKRLEAAQAVQGKVRELRGTAESDNGFITASYTAEQGFDSLELDPRAMRMPSEDLAAEILATSRRAREDFEEQHQTLTSGAVPEPPVAPRRPRPRSRRWARPSPVGSRTCRASWSGSAARWASSQLPGVQAVG